VSASFALRAAAILLFIDGVGFGACGTYGAWSLAAGHGVPTVMGFPSYGGGPFERHGIKSTAPLLLTFVTVCILEVAAGVLLWQGRATGGWLSFALLLPGAVFWWGFALPFGWVFGALRSALLAVGWKDLS
jgi:hypothetical protein